MQPDEDPILARLELARAIAWEAGQITLKYFQNNNFDIERKADDSPVTIADRLAEQHLRDRIHLSMPHDAILGEELGEVPGTSGFRWVLDPIDGTKSFIHGVPLYTTLVAVEQEGRGLIGVIFAPATEEIVYAARGHGAWYALGGQDPSRAQVSDVGLLSESLFVTTEVASFARSRQQDATGTYLQLQNAARLTRTWGDAYGYLMVAVGRAELMVDPIMNLWDAAAVQPIVEEAGGTFTDWSGQPTIQNGEGIATNAHILDEVLAILRETQPR